MSEFEFDRATRVIDGAAELHDGWDIGGNANSDFDYADDGHGDANDVAAEQGCGDATNC